MSVRAATLCLALLAPASAFFVPNVTTCPPGATARPCAYMEPALMPGTLGCFCPGAGPVKTFSLTIQGMLVYPPSYTGGGSKPTVKALVVANGSWPGPPIIADEGDWLVITVTNALEEATTVHWHGQLHYLTPYADGVPGVTQCPIQPGASLTYAFRATHAGSFWYHGHLLEQCVGGLALAGWRWRVGVGGLALADCWRWQVGVGGLSWARGAAARAPRRRPRRA